MDTQLLIIISIIFLTMLVFATRCRCKKVEGFDTEETSTQPDISNSGLSEAVQNVASLYNDKTLVVDNLKVTGNIEVQGESKLGNWNIRDRSIGIEGTGDLHWNTDGWLRMLTYGNTGTDGYGGLGFAGNKFWSGQADYGARGKNSIHADLAANRAHTEARFNDLNNRAVKIGDPLKMHHKVNKGVNMHVDRSGFLKTWTGTPWQFMIARS